MKKIQPTVSSEENEFKISRNSFTIRTITIRTFRLIRFWIEETKLEILLFKNILQVDMWRLNLDGRQPTGKF